MSVVIVYGSGMFCDNQCQDDKRCRHHRGRSNQMAEPRTYMEKHNGNTLNTVLYQKVSGRYKQVAKSSRYLIYRFSYGKKLYFSSADDETSDIPGVIFEHFPDRLFSNQNRPQIFCQNSCIHHKFLQPFFICSGMSADKC